MISWKGMQTTAFPVNLTTSASNSLADLYGFVLLPAQEGTDFRAWSFILCSVLSSHLQEMLPNIVGCAFSSSFPYIWSASQKINWDQSSHVNLQSVSMNLQNHLLKKKKGRQKSQIYIYVCYFLKHSYFRFCYHLLLRYKSKNQWVNLTFNITSKLLRY